MYIPHFIAPGFISVSLSKPHSCLVFHLSVRTVYSCPTVGAYVPSICQDCILMPHSWWCSIYLSGLYTQAPQLVPMFHLSVRTVYSSPTVGAYVPSICQDCILMPHSWCLCSIYLSGLYTHAPQLVVFHLSVRTVYSCPIGGVPSICQDCILMPHSWCLCSIYLSGLYTHAPQLVVFHLSVRTVYSSPTVGAYVPSICQDCILKPHSWCLCSIYLSGLYTHAPQLVPMFHLSVRTVYSCPTVGAYVPSICQDWEFLSEHSAHRALPHFRQ